MTIKITYTRKSCSRPEIVACVESYKDISFWNVEVTYINGETEKFFAVESVEVVPTQEDSIKFTLKELEKFYISAFNGGFESKLVCGGLGRIDEYNGVSPQTLAEAIIKAKGGFKDE